MLGCRYSFEAYVKTVKEKATKCSLKEVPFNAYLILIFINNPKS